jgi:hypothetical protein
MRHPDKPLISKRRVITGCLRLHAAFHSTTPVYTYTRLDSQKSIVPGRAAESEIYHIPAKNTRNSEGATDRALCPTHRAASSGPPMPDCGTILTFQKHTAIGPMPAEICSLTSRCTPGPQRRITRWEHEDVLAVQKWLDEIRTPCARGAGLSSTRSAP